VSDTVKTPEESMEEIKEFMTDVFDLRDKLCHLMIDNKVDMDISLIAMSSLTKELLRDLQQNQTDMNVKKYIKEKTAFFFYMKKNYDQYVADMSEKH